jgi:hypothetical protein
MAIGQELLDIPFAELVRNLAFAIAEGQLQLDRSSIETLRFLMDPRNSVPIVPEIAEIIEATERTVTVGGPEGPRNVTISGVNIRASGASPIDLTLLQAGVQPTFYQFTEAQVEVKLSISIRRVETTETSGTRPLLFGGFVAFAAPVNYRSANTFQYSADGASVLRATLRPVPPPPRVVPATVTINTLTSPPTVTRTA